MCNIRACKFIEEYGKQNGYHFQHAILMVENFILKSWDILLMVMIKIKI